MSKILAEGPERFNAPVAPMRGRQAEAAINDARVLRAAREVFATSGWDAPVARVAEVAGVGMGSLYRRYGSKDDLLRHLCLLSLQQMKEFAHFALAVPPADAWAAFEVFVCRCVSNRVGAFGTIAGRLSPTAAMSRAAEEANGLVEQLVSTCQDSGDLRSDLTAVDVHQLLELFSRRERGGSFAATPARDDIGGAASTDRLLALMLGGMRGGSRQTELPPVDSWDGYRASWDNVSD